jgi:hypothetical protein
MDMYTNKKFTDLINGRVVQVTDQFEDIVILDNKTKIKVNKLLDSNLYDEYIDPMNFFRNEGLVNAFAEKIRQLPNNVLQQQENFDSPRQLLNNYGNPYEYVDDSPAVLPYDPEEEKQQLIMKAKKMFDNRNEVSSQFDKFKDILGDDEINDLNDEVNIEDYDNPEIFEDIEIPKKPNPIRMENIINQQLSTSSQIQQQSMDPIIQMFRNVKRNTDFNIKFEVNNKIPRLDFIEMMEDSYNTSIIDFLAEEFTNQILLNPQIIKNKIIKLDKFIYLFSS